MINIILNFIFFAVIGYITEVLYVYLGDRKWINRGFLHGPYIPIYAFGSLFIIAFLSKYYNDYLVVFFMGMIICSGLEYFTSHVMEMIFNRRWWDYSNHKYNLNGRISLKNSILFGIGSLLIIYFISPLINIFISKLSLTLKIVIVVFFLIIFLTDLTISSIEAYWTNKNIKLVNDFKKKINKKQKALLANIKTRILKAYPYLTKNNEELIEQVKKIKKDFKQKIKKSKKKKL